LNSIQPTNGASVSLLGYEGSLKWEKVGKGFSVELPQDVQTNPPCDYAWTIRISEIKSNE
jgi:alpha-L-fucosidase